MRLLMRQAARQSECSAHPLNGDIEAKVGILRLTHSHRSRLVPFMLDKQHEGPNKHYHVSEQGLVGIKRWLALTSMETSMLNDLQVPLIVNAKDL